MFLPYTFVLRDRCLTFFYMFLNECSPGNSLFWCFSSGESVILVFPPLKSTIKVLLSFIRIVRKFLPYTFVFRDRKLKNHSHFSISHVFLGEKTPKIENYSTESFRSLNLILYPWATWKHSKWFRYRNECTVWCLVHPVCDFMKVHFWAYFNEKHPKKSTRFIKIEIAVAKHKSVWQEHLNGLEEVTQQFAVFFNGGN